MCPPLEGSGLAPGDSPGDTRGVVRAGPGSPEHTRPLEEVEAHEVFPTGGPAYDLPEASQASRATEPRDELAWKSLVGILRRKGSLLVRFPNPHYLY